MEIATKRIVSYLKAEYLLHMITVIEIMFFWSLFYLADIPSWLSSDYIFIKIIVLSPMIGLPLFAQLDARSRYQNINW